MPLSILPIDDNPTDFDIVSNDNKVGEICQDTDGYYVMYICVETYLFTQADIEQILLELKKLNSNDPTTTES